MEKSVEKVVWEIAQPITDQVGVEIVDVEYTKEGRGWRLLVTIDRPGGVSLEDCQKVTQPLSLQLDELDPIPHSYRLEVASPGAERPISNENDWRRAVGRHVRVQLHEALEGEIVFQGELLEHHEEQIRVRTKKGTVQIPRERVAKARLAVHFG